jgi:hypothetical protein
MRYGVIGINDLARDLEHWETLLVSSMMHRPIKILVNETHEFKDIWGDLQQQNLESAIAYAALTSKDGISEQEFYEGLIEIPKYESKYW